MISFVRVVWLLMFVFSTVGLIVLNVNKDIETTLLCLIVFLATSVFLIKTEQKQ